MLDIHFIRHAQSTGNANPHLIGGRSNHFPITELGIRQSRALGERLEAAQMHFDKIYASTAVRAIQTARIASKHLQFDHNEISQHDDLVELCQGEWTGKVRAEMYNEATLKKIHADPWNFKAPGGESQKEVEERIYQWLEENLLPLAEQDLKIAVFCHGMVIKCISRKLLDSNPAMTYRITIENTSITQFQYDEHGWHLKRINDYAHLEMTDLERPLGMRMED